MKDKNLKSPIDLQNKDDLTDKNEVGKRPFYSATLDRNNRTAEPTSFGGTVKRTSNDVVDEDTDSPEAGTPGAPGIDEGTG